MTAQSEIDGSIQIKSYLQGNPEIRLGLNSNIILGRDKDISSKKEKPKKKSYDNKQFLSKYR